MAHLAGSLTHPNPPGRAVTAFSTTDYRQYRAIKGWADHHFGTCPPAQARYYCQEVRRFVGELRGAVVLELGFGNGEFLAYSRSEGAIAHGVEVQPDLVALAQQAGYSAFASIEAASAELEPHSVDLVVAFDVMEHLSTEGIVELLVAARGLLRPDTGLLLARFPNGDSPFSFVHQHGDHTHQSIIGSGLITNLLQSVGWQPCYLGAEASAPGSHAKRLQYAARSAGRWAVEKLAAFLYYGQGAPPTLSANYVLWAATCSTNDSAAVDQR